MMGYNEVLTRFTEKSREILGGALVGIYLHGSAVMGCFNPKKSDLDLLIVVNGSIPDDTKRRFMEMTVSLNEQAPAKGIEMSIVKREVCKPFVYPTPFELHFSSGTLGWYKSDPDDYIAKMNGTDKDLAAHVTVINHRGKTLFGLPTAEVFGEVSREAYLDSLWYDIGNAAEDIAEDPMYIILNLARVLAYCREGSVLSKKEGGEWGISHLPERFHGLIEAALTEYETSEAGCYDERLSAEYAEYMLAEIAPEIH